MAKTLTASLILVLVAGLMVAAFGSSGREAAAGGVPTDTPTATATSTSTPTATSTPAVTATATPGTATVAAGTATATPRLPAAAPQTGGEPGSGSETLILTLLIGALAIMSAGGVFAGYALGRRRS